MWLSLLVVTVLAYSTMFAAVSAPNERSRLYLAVALIDHATVSIDEPLRRFGRIFDTARVGSHYYSDKAPGSSLLAALVYGCVRIFTDAADWTITELLTLVRRAVMLPVGLAGFWVLRKLLARIVTSRASVDLVSLGWILGTAAFHYSTALYGHQIAGVCLLLALYCLLSAEQSHGPRPRGAFVLCVLAGACGGMAGVTEYQAGLVSLLLALFFISGPLRRKPSLWFGFAAGALPFVLLLGAYHTLAFGGPFELSYHHLANSRWREIHTEGIGGITWPQLESFVGTVFSLHRGLLATSPMFLLALPGLWVLWRRGERRLAALLGAGCATYLWLISSSNMWVAGWGYGPRLLVPAMGWAALLAGVGAEWLVRWRIGEVFARASLAVGLVLHQTVHAVFPEPPHDAANPWADVVLPLIERDIVAPNLVFTFCGIWGWASLIPLLILLLVPLTMMLFASWTPRPWATVRELGSRSNEVSAQETASAGLRPAEEGLPGKGSRHTVWVGVASALIVAAVVTSVVGRGATFAPSRQRLFLEFVTWAATGERPKEARPHTPVRTRER